jgi:hypothetical protein
VFPGAVAFFLNVLVLIFCYLNVTQNLEKVIPEASGDLFEAKFRADQAENESLSSLGSDSDSSASI